MKLSVEINIPLPPPGVEDADFATVVTYLRRQQSQRLSKMGVLRREIDAIEQDSASAQQFAAWEYD